jgi:hypothetical protein
MEPKLVNLAEGEKEKPGFHSASSTFVIWGYPFIVSSDGLLLIIAASFTIGFTWYYTQPGGKRKWL